MAQTVRRAAKVMTPISVFDRAVRPRHKTAVLATDWRQPSLSLPARGFTLLELMLVLAIVAMASFVVFPNLTGLETRTFNARVREAHTLLNLARRTAVVSGQPSVASFSVDPAAEPSAARSSFSVGQWDGSGIELTFQDSADQEVEVQDFLDITFFPEGGSTGGSLLLVYQDRLASIVINPFTGRVETEFLDER
jgi:general secretion pathway protein H